MSEAVDDQKRGLVGMFWRRHAQGLSADDQPKRSVDPLDRYQDVLMPEKVLPGVRDCAARWALLEHLLPESGILVDVGSNLGYFAIRAALERPALAVVSIESDAAIAARQAALVARHGLDRICVLQGKMTASTARAWARTCDWIDVTLLLSVLHWTDEPEIVLSELASMSGTVVVELPDAEDEGACGYQHRQLWRDPVQWVRRVTGRRVELLGRPIRHTSGVASHLLAVLGPTSRRPQVAYWGNQYRHPLGNEYKLSYDGQAPRITIRGRERPYRPGINLATLMSLGRLLYPPQRYWLRSGAQAVRNSPGHPDPMPHNMVWSAAGLHLVDDEPLAAPRPLGEASEVLRRNVAGWQAGRTVHPASYVAETFGVRTRLRRLAGTVLRRILPAPVFSWLRASVTRHKTLAGPWQ